MSVIVAGTFRIPPENFAGLKPHLQTVVAETRKEDGCLTYSYARDVEDPGLIRVFEHWRDQAALDAHFQAPHMIAWQKVRVEHGFHDRQIWSHDVTDGRAI
ncbi:putative quinol monooxygenase [Phenylobacterium sp. LjRoot225]|uniref:putative quinol monooxygenase n=1 Tax=Phenylobacterium sp. LjRoot225 TaxID=3342285 RepID=UPI003ECFE85F